MNLEQEFDRRIAAMHGLNNPYPSDRNTDAHDCSPDMGALLSA